MSGRYSQLELEQQFCFALYAACRAVTRTYRPLLADPKEARRLRYARHKGRLART